FTVDGDAVESDDVNHRLAELTGAHFTAKDFRTWKGSTVAFAHLRAHLDDEPAGSESTVVAAVDAAADALSNTRTVCRAHYVHPDVVDGFTSGELARYLRGRRARGPKALTVDEKLMLGFLSQVLETRAGELAVE
ncbi:MAG: DNA topoisomerase IB, partial [Jatrophihabitans endophyticus]|nr:DNA topoisomerase IB [Jatrophihabitans endophyticus]